MRILHIFVLMTLLVIPLALAGCGGNGQNAYNAESSGDYNTMSDTEAMTGSDTY